MSEYVSSVPVSHLLQNPPLIEACHAEETRLTPEQSAFLSTNCSGILSRHPSLAGACFTAVLRALPLIMEKWCELAPPANASEEESKEVYKLPAAITSLMTRCGEVVEVLVDERKALEEADVQLLPHTDAHTYTVGLCLSWRLCLCALDACSPSLAPLYALQIQPVHMLPAFLSTLVRLLSPSHPLRFPPSATHRPPNMLFAPVTSLQPHESLEAYVVTWLASQLYLCSLRSYPHWCRAWFNRQPKARADAVRAYTERLYSPTLIQEELKGVREFKSSEDNVSFKVLGERRVAASYLVDDCELSMFLELPACLPLSAVSMGDSSQSGVSPRLYNGWKHGLKSVLAYSNTPLTASLDTWKANLDRKYQGVEPCYICYCIMQAQHLPSQACRTCKHKFHSSCVYYWFSKSKKSSCPMCRSDW